MHGYIRDRKEVPNDVKLLTLHFCYVKAYRCHDWRATVVRWLFMHFLQDFLVLSSKKVIRVLSTRDYLILLITNTSHKVHLFSCAQRCSSKLQKIQSLKNFFSMAIQGTQVPMYTNSHCFCIFLIFQFFFLIFMKKKSKLKINKQKHVKKSNA